MHIQDKSIRAFIHDEKEYRYGRYIDIQLQLERMTISLDETSGCYRLHARLLDNRERLTLSLKISQTAEILYGTCGCSQIGHCRHMAAILFYLRTLSIDSFPYCYEKSSDIIKTSRIDVMKKEREQRILSKKNQYSTDFIQMNKDQFTRESLALLSSQTYQLKVFVQKEKNGLDITLKVCEKDHHYIVKNFEAFFHAIDYHEYLRYSKNFAFVHSENVFDEDSLDILTFMRHLFLKNQFLQKNILKTLYVAEDDLDQFYELMNALPSSYCDIAFQKKAYIIPLDITETTDNYIIDLADYQELESAFLTSHAIYKMGDDVMYKYDFQNSEKVVSFVKRILESQGGLYITEDMMMDFYKYILLDVLQDVDLKSELFSEYCQENLINLYVDMTSEEQICLQLEYIYDHELVYGFQPQVYKSKEVDLIENYLEPFIDDHDHPIMYLHDDHDFAHQFMKESLPYLASYCQVYVSDALKRFSTSQDLQIQVGVHLSQDLLSIDIQSVHIHKEELTDILKAYKKKRKFYKLKNGDIVSLENKQLKELEALMETLHYKPQDIVDGHIDVPAYRLFEVDKLTRQRSLISYSQSASFQSGIGHLENPSDTYPLPEHYHNILREYQVKGYQWLRHMASYGFGGILADDMGLGKTVQMIAYFDSLQNVGTHIVITPASLLLNWQDEIEKFSSCLRVLCIHGHKSYRESCIENLEDYDVVLTSYDYLRRDISLYEAHQFHTVVLDEAQSIKNPKTRNAFSVKKLKAKQRFALTGTPIENSLAELWSIFDFLMPYYLYHYSYFLEHFERPIVKDRDEEKQQRLREMIAPFVLRRNKKDVLKELPDKIEQTFYVRFAQEEEKLYLSHLVQVNKTLQDKLDIQQLGKMDILAMLTKLRQLCQDPRLIDETIDDTSSKLKACIDLIKSLKSNQKKILLFSSFTSVLKLIAAECQREHISYYVLDGSVSKEKRKTLVDAFQSDETTLFLISLKAGGSGLNLTRAQAVIHFDPWWNMSVQNQATDRAHRIGQTETVQVFSLIMKNSIEEKIMELQKQKQDLADIFVEGHSQSLMTMSMEAMQSLFAIPESDYE